ncbi:Uncharacterised protein [Mycobacteroides abscessus subsp. abscessus]|nr:Uncharacterised protein [Mycobacteroides abscessus subsp. abscessus]
MRSTASEAASCSTTIVSTGPAQTSGAARVSTQAVANASGMK